MTGREFVREGATAIAVSRSRHPACVGQGRYTGPPDRAATVPLDRIGPARGRSGDDRDASGLPRGWIARQKSALRSLGWRFNSDRMVMDYVMSSYLPAAGGLSCLMPRS